MKIKQAFVLAGGKGERLRPLTDNIPKPLVEVAGKPILEYNLEVLAAHGIEEIILGTGYLHEKIEKHLDSWGEFGAQISYSVEKEALGTGGALRLCADRLDDRFIMLNGDNIANFNLTALQKFHEKKGALATLELVKVDDVSSFGIAKLEEDDKITEFVEKPSPENSPGNLANAGAYVLEKSVLEFLPEGFSLIEKTVFPALAKRAGLFGFEHRGYWFPTDTFERLKMAEEGLKLRLKPK